MIVRAAYLPEPIGRAAVDRGWTDNPIFPNITLMRGDGPRGTAAPISPNPPTSNPMTNLIRLVPVLLLMALVAACAQPEQTDSAAEATDASQRPDPTNSLGSPEGEVPAGWIWRFDREGDYSVGQDPDSSDVWFVTMTPGWHVTTGPAGIYYHPASTASGAYTATTLMHLFPPGERNEAYGLFVGGSDLDGPNQAYLYFLIRRSGEFLVKRRMGAETEEVVGWTASDAIVPYTAETEGTASNRLTVRVEEDTVHFLVNDQEVASMPREGLPTDGVVGLRLNHSINVHVEDFTVTMAS